MSRGLLIMVLLCTVLSYQPDFKLDQYLGKWFEVARSSSIRFEKGVNITEEYGKIDNDKTSVVYREILPNGKPNLFSGYAVTAGDNPAHFLIYFTSSWFMKYFPADYRVMATNYEEYSIIYSYSKILWWEFKMAWVYSRDPHMSEDRVTELLTDVQNLTGISSSDMVRSHQDINAKVAEGSTNSPFKAVSF